MNAELRKAFAKLKSKCKTSSQRKAFNEMVKSFSSKSLIQNDSSIDKFSKSTYPISKTIFPTNDVAKRALEEGIIDNTEYLEYTFLRDALFNGGHKLLKRDKDRLTNISIKIQKGFKGVW